MIKLVRVDERLVHGQVALAWTNSLGADSILIVNDSVKKDSLRQKTLKLAAPAGIKFVVKTVAEAKELLSGTKTEKYKLFVIVDNTADALELVRHVPAIRKINLGNMKMKEGARAITKSICVTQEDEANIREMGALDAEVLCQAIPTEKPEEALRLI